MVGNCDIVNLLLPSKLAIPFGDPTPKLVLAVDTLARSLKLLADNRLPSALTLLNISRISGLVASPKLLTGMNFTLVVSDALVVPCNMIIYPNIIPVNILLYTGKFSLMLSNASNAADKVLYCALEYCIIISF